MKWTTLALWIGLFAMAAMAAAVLAREPSKPPADREGRPRAEQPDDTPLPPGDQPLAKEESSGNDELRREADPPPPPEDAPQPVTVEQKAKVKEILSKYDASSLTANDAKIINEAFRAAGLRNGPGLQEAIRDAGFVPDRIGELDPPPDRPEKREPGAGPNQDRGGKESRDEQPRGGGPRGKQARGGPQPRPGQGGGYSIEQAISDRAQLHTIAFDGLAFLTGDFGSATFLPPGKVADYCGFQYMRDVDTNGLGHNTSFVPRVADNVLSILTERQKAQLVALAKEQETMLADFAYKRFPLIKAFHRQLEGDVPAGVALSREAVMKYTAAVFEIDGQLSFRRAQVLGGIVRSLTDQQKQYLGKMAFKDSSTWPVLEDQLDRRSLSHTAHVAVMTYASEMFSWYAGNVEADVYFCPERHATYFGSFYMKDIPAMGNPNYSISTSLTGDSGEAFLEALTDAQRKLVTRLIDQQRADLAEIVKTRRAIAVELRRFMKEDSVDRAKTQELSKRYGELDGEISYFYAKAFAEVAKTLTPEQKQKLLRLRNLDAKYRCRGAYLYSRAIDMPKVPNTDFLFAAPTEDSKAPSASAPQTSPPATEGSVGAGTASAFALRSPAVENGGALPKEYTGDDAATSLPLEWSGAPAGTKSFAILMHHDAPDGLVKSYWVIYNIPADATRLPKKRPWRGNTRRQ